MILIVSLLLAVFLLSLAYFVLVVDEDAVDDHWPVDYDECCVCSLFKAYWSWLKESVGKLVTAFYNNEYKD